MLFQYKLKLNNKEKKNTKKYNSHLVPRSCVVNIKTDRFSWKRSLERRRDFDFLFRKNTNEKTTTDFICFSRSLEVFEQPNLLTHQTFF